MGGEAFSELLQTVGRIRKRSESARRPRRLIPGACRQNAGAEEAAQTPHSLFVSNGGLTAKRWLNAEIQLE